MSGRTSAQARQLTASLKLTIEAVARCRELLVNADADADDLAEYDAATTALRYTLEDWLATYPPRPAGRSAIAAARGGKEPVAKTPGQLLCEVFQSALPSNGWGGPLGWSDFDDASHATYEKAAADFLTRAALAQQEPNHG